MTQDADKAPLKGRRYTIRFTVLSLFLAVSGLVALVSLALHYFFSFQLAEEAAEIQFVNIAERSAERARQLERRGISFAYALQNNEEVSLPLGAVAEYPLVRQMSHLMTADDGIFSLYLGQPDGAYLELSNLDAARDLRSIWQATPEDRWVLIQVFDDGGEHLKVTQFLDGKLHTREQKMEASQYYANERPWFKAATDLVVHKMLPYMLSITQRPAVSYSVKAQSGAVVGSITLLSSLDQLLVNHRYPQTSHAFIFNREGMFSVFGAKNKTLQRNTNDEAISQNTGLNAEQLVQPRLLDIAANPASHEKLNTIVIDDKSYFVYVSLIKGFADQARQEYVGLIVTEEEVVSRYRQQLIFSTLIILAVLLLLVPVVLMAVRFIVHPVNRLIAENNKVRLRQYQKVQYVPSAIKELHQLSQSLVGMSESICEYETAQKDLMDAFIKLIAQAIDDKSPYTGGHCERVPKLAFLLAEAACQQKEGPFKDFNLDGEEAWREFQVAAWLHDCGKITTPEHIVDKGTKLEAIYNRIHEIRMRFEVLWRDAEIAYWQHMAETPEQASELKQQLDQRLVEIKEDFAFVAACNVGGEFMDDDQIERLQQIARQTWTRNLSRHLGLSPVEELVMSEQEDCTPQQECLLQDNPEHITPRQEDPEKYAGFGFTLQPTQAKQNLGEVYNLSIRRGTLTDEDRYIINEHITSTIRMLETLPLPAELQKVPEYAGGHHEAMSGKGYPRGLTGSQLSVPARIMAIADIFEALAASDRPYKKAKTLSESLTIMKFMVKDEHIDRELFRLFVQSNLHVIYARDNLSEEQLDELDTQALLSELDSMA